MKPAVVKPIDQMEASIYDAVIELEARERREDERRARFVWWVRCGYRLLWVVLIVLLIAKTVD